MPDPPAGFHDTAKALVIAVEEFLLRMDVAIGDPEQVCSALDTLSEAFIAMPNWREAVATLRMRRIPHPQETP
jgi:hypothetical protein